MYYFHNDYNRMCHPAVLNKLQQMQYDAMPGYGTDRCCGDAAELIRDLCGNKDLSVHFLTGGTQANLTVITAALRPHQAVIGAQSAHIHVHETGAVEACGHKVLALPSVNGKITAAQVEKVALDHRNDADQEHIAQPKMVYISNSTELGTIYSLQELTELSVICKKYGYYLFMDGARLGYALAADGNDVALADLARLTDVFYLGGTKQGAMFGEAVIISNSAIAEDFRYIIKQRGGMLAKGWLLGLQFQALLENNLYFEIARKANSLADRVRSTIHELGYSFLVEGNTNQIFPILPDRILNALSSYVTFSEMGRVDAQSRAVRFCTSWASKEEDVDYLCNLLRELSN